MQPTLQLPDDQQIFGQQSKHDLKIFFWKKLYYLHSAKRRGNHFLFPPPYYAKVVPIKIKNFFIKKPFNKTISSTFFSFLFTIDFLNLNQRTYIHKKAQTIGDYNWYSKFDYNHKFLSNHFFPALIQVYSFKLIHLATIVIPFFSLFLYCFN